MKIRTGFVSNSSSSSFVVAWPHRPKDARDAQEMLFPGQYDWGHVTIYDNVMHVKDVAEKVFCDTDAKSMTVEDMAATFEILSLDDEYSNVSLKPYVSDADASFLARSENEKEAFCKETYAAERAGKLTEVMKKKRSDMIDAHYKLEDCLRSKYALAKAKDFASANKKKFFSSYSYSDNDGETVMEHGDIFRNLNHVKINCH